MILSPPISWLLNMRTLKNTRADLRLVFLARHSHAEVGPSSLVDGSLIFCNVFSQFRFVKVLDINCRIKETFCKKMNVSLAKFNVFVQVSIMLPYCFSIIIFFHCKILFNFQNSDVSPLLAFCLTCIWNWEVETKI